MRKVYCIRCGKSLLEGDDCIRHEGFTGFYCSYRCLALDVGIAIESKVTDELVQEDKLCNGYDWDK